MLKQNTHIKQKNVNYDVSYRYTKQQRLGAFKMIGGLNGSVVSI